MRLCGVTFRIWRDGELLGDYETDALGEILLTDCRPGTYRVQEVDTGDSGHLVDFTPQEIELKAGDSIKELYFFNDQKPGIWLVKVDSADPSKVIPNARFRIEAVDGNFGPAEFTTDQNGEIDLSELPTGAYVVTELECPATSSTRPSGSSIWRPIGRPVLCSPTPSSPPCTSSS